MSLSQLPRPWRSATSEDGGKGCSRPTSLPVPSSPPALVDRPPEARAEAEGERPLGAAVAAVVFAAATRLRALWAASATAQVRLVLSNSDRTCRRLHL